MSAHDLAEISACLRRMRVAENDRLRIKKTRYGTSKSRRNKQMGLLDLPEDLLFYILQMCDEKSRSMAMAASATLAAAWNDNTEEPEMMMLDMNDNFQTLDCLPADVILLIFKYLDLKSLGRVAQVCRRLKSVAYTDCLWIRSAAQALGSNQLDPAVLRKSQVKYSPREKVKIGHNWRQGLAVENVVTVHNNKYMPRLQLERDKLWVSWGKTIWCHPRVKDGGISSATTKMLRGHKDDVSKFVVSSGMVVSGGRDRSIFGWNSKTGEFLFARRYCHGSEVTAIDVTARGSIIVSGSRDKTMGIWALGNDFSPFLVKQLGVGDRVWSLNVSQETGLTVIGTSGLRGTAPLRLFDISQGQAVLDLGSDLRHGAGMLDVAWLNESSLLSCGYDTCTRLWDTRCGTYVMTWEETCDESVYSIETDRVNCLVTGTARHGRCSVWDFRNTKPVYTLYATPAWRGQSSPCYSLVMDSANLYVALDQSLNHFAFL